MKLNKWTLALASAGVVSLASVANAEEKAMSQVLTAVSSTTLSGYVDTSAIWKFGTGNGGAGVGDTLPGRALDGTSKMDGFNLNAVSLTIEKPLSEDTWAAGYGAQILFGPDAAVFNPSYTVASTGDADLAVKQAYVALRIPIQNGLDLKMGVFNSIIGYEVFDSYLDPNYSRSYGWQLEPIQHTGLLASYQLTEAVSVAGGVANTWSPGINTRNTLRPDGTTIESAKTYMASLTITAPDSWGFLSGSTFYGGVVSGFGGNSVPGEYGESTTSVYLGTQLKPGVEGLTLGAALDYRFNGANQVTPGDNWAWAIAGYLSFKATEKWTLSGRVDYMTGSDGTFYNGGQDIGNYGTEGPIISDRANQLFGLTLTADYALWANVISRAEFRWDTTANSDQPFGVSDKNALTLAANLIYKF